MARYVRKATGRMYINPDIPHLQGYEYVGKGWMEKGGKAIPISMEGSEESTTKQEEEGGVTLLPD